jgi:hypothetical protein
MRASSQSTRRAFFFGTVAVAVWALASCRPQPDTHPGVYPPVTAADLAGRRFTVLGAKGQFLWAFSNNKSFEITGSIPAAIINVILGPNGDNTQPQQITGGWALAADTLNLSGVTVDGKPTGQSARVHIYRTGPIRIDVGSEQFVFK